MNRTKGILYAAVSSSTFGLAPFFTLMLLSRGLAPLEVLSYRWGVAAVFLALVGWTAGCRFRLEKKDLGAVFGLSLLRAATSLSLIVAYQHIASGVASTIHFMYPLAVALAMVLFFREKGSLRTFVAIGVSVAGAILLSGGEIGYGGSSRTIGIAAACISVVSYGGYIVGVRQSRAARIEPTTFTFYIMGLGALYFIIGAAFTSGLPLATSGIEWIYILGLALPATAVSNMALVKAVRYIGPTLTSLFGALEPLTAVVLGIIVFRESFTMQSAVGILLILLAVSAVVFRSGHNPGNNPAKNFPAKNRN